VAFDHLKPLVERSSCLMARTLPTLVRWSCRSPAILLSLATSLGRQMRCGGRACAQTQWWALTQANIGNVLATRDLMTDIRAADPFRQGRQTFSESDERF
jgi:hypothetical protein